MLSFLLSFILYYLEHSLYFLLFFFCFFIYFYLLLYVIYLLFLFCLSYTGRLGSSRVFDVDQLSLPRTPSAGAAASGTLLRGPPSRVRSFFSLFL